MSSTPPPPPEPLPPEPPPTDTPSSTPPVPPAPPAPPNPDMQALDLLGQAFNHAGEINDVIIAGLIGAGLSRMTAMINRAARQDAEIDRLRAQLAAPPTVGPPVS